MDKDTISISQTIGNDPRTISCLNRMAILWMWGFCTQKPSILHRVYFEMPKLEIRVLGIRKKSLFSRKKISSQVFRSYHRIYL